MQHNRALLFISATCALVLCARLFFVIAAPSSPLLAYAGAMGVVEGVVSGDPDRREHAVRAVVSVRTVNGRSEAGKVLAVLPRDTTLQHGDTVVLRGLLAVPESFETDTGRVFDYPGYLAARGVSVLAQRAELLDIHDGSWSVARTLYSLKHTFEHALERVMREPHASFMKGLLLGERAGLPKELTDAFILVGLIHVVVLSGYNIGVVSEGVLRVLGLVLPRKAALAVAGVAIVLFAIMVGGGMATVRATLMGLIAVLARYLERPALALRALAAAAGLMIAYNPLVVFDVGFVLSILATFGIVTTGEWFEKKLPLKAGVVRSVGGTTLAAQAFVLPALLYFTGVLSFVSLPLNIVVLPLIPIAMLLGFAAGALALLHPYLALIPAILAEHTLSFVMWLSLAASEFPLAVAVLPPFPVWVAIAAYVPMVLFALRLYRSAAQ